MARALFERRNFLDRTTNKVIEYDFYGIVGDDGGLVVELPLKSLSPSEKIAFRSVAKLDNPVIDKVDQQTPEDAKDEFFKDMSDDDDKINLDD